MRISDPLSFGMGRNVRHFALRYTLRHRVKKCDFVGELETFLEF